jgi:hypothetical protein
MRYVSVIALVFAAACRGAQVDVRNRSSEILQDVTISARQASSTLDRISPGDSRRTSLCPQGEAGGVDISFKVNGQPHHEQRPVYFECDFLYRVQVEISPAFEVTASARLR